MNRKRRVVRLLCMAIALLLCLPAQTALAGRSADLIVNGVELVLNHPYLANGSTVASATPPASGGYVYYDALAANLTLHNAVLNTPFVIPDGTSTMGLIYANINLTVTLSGASSITYSGSYTPGVAAMVSAGTLTIGGSGSLNVSIQNSAARSRSYGICTPQALTINSGTLSLDVRGGDLGYGLYTNQDIVYAGGQAQIQTVGANSLALYSVLGNVHLAGGSITALCESTGVFAVGVFGQQVLLEGAKASFTAKGLNGVYGMAFLTNAVTYTGGDYTFSGTASALGYNGTDTSPTVYTLGNATVLASTNADGSSAKRWKSDADGRLTSSNAVPSAFRYVRIYTAPPEMGDNSSPLLWAGIALCALLLAAGLGLAARRRRAA